MYDNALNSAKGYSALQSGSVLGEMASSCAQERRVMKHGAMASDNLQRLSSLSSRLDMIATRLVGPRPQLADKQSEQTAPGSPSLEASLAATNTSLAILLSACERHLNAIEEFI